MVEPTINDRPELRPIGTEFCTVPTDFFASNDTGPLMSIHYRISDHVLVKVDEFSDLTQWVEKLETVAVVELPAAVFFQIMR